MDFLDPALPGDPGDRERGARLEVRPLTTTYEGSAYAGATTTLAPAVCRIDLLESAPGAADRMHWHPTMHDGEPGERTFDPEVPADPTAWLAARLGDPASLLTGVADPLREQLLLDAAAIAAQAPAIARAAAESLEAARGPWPDVAHDERGLAPVAEPG